MANSLFTASGRGCQAGGLGGFSGTRHSTDLAQPPAFVFAQAERGPGDNTLEYGGEALAEQQRKAYPQVASLHLSASKAEVWAGVKALIAENNWRVLGEDKSRGHIEAVATTRVMGFADDIVIRIRDKAAPVKVASEASGKSKDDSPVAENLIVDMRSVSRVGVSDLGANGARIESFLTTLQNQLKK